MKVLSVLLLGALFLSTTQAFAKDPAVSKTEYKRTISRALQLGSGDTRILAGLIAQDNNGRRRELKHLREELSLALRKRTGLLPSLEQRRIDAIKMRMRTLEELIAYGEKFQSQIEESRALYASALEALDVVADGADPKCVASKADGDVERPKAPSHGSATDAH